MKIYSKFYIICAIVLTSCSNNVLQEFSSRDTSEALYADAVKLMDNSLFDDAFSKLNLIETQDVNFATKDRFKKTKAGIQAGQCGLTFITFIVGLSQASGGNAFKMLMSAFQGINVNPQKCTDAHTTMLTLTSTDDDQLLFLAVLGMAKVGANLRDKADRDGAGSLGDGIGDGTFDACGSATAADAIDDNDLKQVITGLGLTLQNIALIGGSFTGSSASTSLSTLQAFCDDPAGNGTGGINDADKIDCQIMDPNSPALTPELLRGFRRVIASFDQGVGAAAPGCNLNPLDPAYCCPALATP